DASCLGYHDIAQYRDEPARRTGVVFHQLSLCRTPEQAAAAMTTASRAVVDGGGAAKRDERRAAIVACGAHALRDRYTALILVMLPVWQSEFGLGYAELGMLRGLFAGTMAAFQIPSGLLAEQFGIPLVLAGGTGLAGLGYCLAGASSGYGMLILALLVG